MTGKRPEPAAQHGMHHPGGNNNLDAVFCGLVSKKKRFTNARRAQGCSLEVLTATFSDRFSRYSSAMIGLHARHTDTPSPSGPKIQERNFPETVSSPSLKAAKSRRENSAGRLGREEPEESRAWSQAPTELLPAFNIRATAMGARSGQRKS